MTTDDEESIGPDELPFGAAQAERETLEDAEVLDPYVDGAGFLRRVAERVERMGEDEAPALVGRYFSDPAKVAARARLIADHLDAEFRRIEAGPPPIRFFDPVLGIRRVLRYDEGESQVGIPGGWEDREDTAPPAIAAVVREVLEDACRAAGFAGPAGFATWCDRLATAIENRLGVALQPYDKAAKEVAL